MGPTSKADGPVHWWVERARVLLCLASIGIGGVAMLGWLLHVQILKTALPGLTTMKLSTALGLVAAGSGCLCVPPRPGATGRRVLLAACVLFLLAAGLGTLIEYLSGVGLGIDELFVADPATTSKPYPGRMASATAVALLAIGLALLILASARTPRVVKLGHLVAVVPAAISYLALTGYANGVDSLYNFGPFASVALHAALGLGLSSAAILLTRQQDGWGAIFANHPIAAAVLVRLLLLAILVPFAAGQLIVLGARSHFYQPLFGPALFATLTAAAYSWVAIKASMVLRGAEDEIERQTAALARSEAATREKEQRLGAALAVAKLGTFTWDLRSGAVTLDDRGREIFGFAPWEGGTADDIFARLHHDDRDRVRSEIDASGRAMSRLETQYRIVLPDATAQRDAAWAKTRFVESVTVAVPGADGRPDTMLGIWSDVTERQLYDEAMRRLNAMLERQVEDRTRERDRLWQTSNDLLGTAGLDGFMKAVNPAWMRVLGWAEADLLGRPFLDFIDPDDHAETMGILGKLATGTSISNFVDRIVIKDGGRRIVMWTADPDPTGDVFYVIGRDLTDQRAAEEQLRQAQKMEAVGQLTGGLAHDFNNLLTGMTGSLDMLQARLRQGRSNEVERYVVAAQGAAQRAAALTHRLLAFSRRQTLDPKPTDVNRLVAGMAELIARTVGPAIAVEAVAAGGLWATLVDAGQLENALLNLCINARDAMPDGGRLTIEAANCWLDQQAARQRDVPSGQYVTLSVSDTGTGMPAEVIARAFDPFFTTKPLGLGTGLGLSMIYGFARQSGGQVRLYSEVGLGTRVCLYLPRHLGDADLVEAAAELADAPRAGAGETVLVVDDEATVRMLVTDVLEELGYVAIEAADGAAGLKVLRSDARIDLLVTDVGLPGGMNGRQVADAARAARPKLKILFITGYAENAVLNHGHLEHGMHVMTKPFAMEALATRIRELIVAA